MDLEQRGTELRVRGHIFSPVVFGDGLLHKLSQREQKFLEKYLATGNLDLACNEVGISRQAGAGYLRRKSIQNYVSDMIRQHAMANGLTIDKLMAKLNGAIDGTVAMTPTQIECCKVAARILKPSQGIQVNVQNNVGVNLASPFATMDTEQLAEEMRKRSNALQATVTRTDRGD